jgi:hypothetical protein
MLLARTTVAAGVIASMALPVLARDGTGPLPQNAQSRSYGRGWDCDLGFRLDKVAFRCICAKDRVACFSTSAKNTTGGERIFAAAAGKSAEIREAPFPRRPKRLLSASTQVDFRSSRLVNCC